MIWLSVNGLALWIAVLFAAVQVMVLDRPNILFISVDDMNDWIGCMSHPKLAEGTDIRRSLTHEI